MVAICLYGQDYILTENIFYNTTQKLNPSESILAIVAERKYQGDIFDKTNELERFCIFSHKYLNDYTSREYIRNLRLEKDLRSIFIDQVELTEQEFSLFEQVILGNKYRSNFKDLSSIIDCKINRFLFKNLDKIFITEKGKPVDNFSNVKSEKVVTGRGRYLVEFSDEGLFRKVTGDLDFKNHKIRYFNECGLIDSIEYRDNNQHRRTEYERTISRNWTGHKEYYADGKLFSEFKNGGDDFFRSSYNFSPVGDTLSLYEDNFIGNFEDFYINSYSRNLEGEITSVDGVGIVNRYSYYLSKDSLTVRAKEKLPKSIFLKLEDVLDISLDEVYQLDSVFTSQFLKNKNEPKETCLANYATGINSVLTEREIDFLPFINVSCDMLSDKIIERKKPSNYSFTQQELAPYFRQFNGELSNEKAIELIFEYNNLQIDYSKGGWMFYPGLIKFLNDKVSDDDLVICYKYIMETVTQVALTVNYKRNENFKVENIGLIEIVDTLGNSFANVRSPFVTEFRSTLNSKEKEALDLITKLYKTSANDYYEKFVKENYDLSYGIEKDKIEYFKLITQWQLKFFNQRLINWKYKVPKAPKELLLQILQKFDQYLGQENYDLLAKAENKIYRSLDNLSPNGVGGYGWTRFNPYLQLNSKMKREARCFNWLFE